MKNNSYINYFSYILFFIVTLILYLYSDFWADYKEIQKSTVLYEQWLDIVNDEIQDFSFSDISDLEDAEFFYTPYPELEDKIIEKIDKSKERVYMQMYILTNDDIISSLISANNRGLDVKVILEQNVYKASHLNKEAYKVLKDAGVDVIWDWDNYALTHTKLLLVDDEAIISTWNYSYSTFSKNRDFFIFTKDKEIVEKSYKLFSIDYSKRKWVVYDDEIILSPYYSREKLSYMLENASESIVLYAQNFSDYWIISNLVDARKRWVQVSWVIAWNDSMWNDETINTLKNAWVNVYDLTSPKIHAKAILVDEKYLYIWSINYSYYSIDKNRELWLIITNKDIIDKFLKVYEKDLKKFVKSR